MAAAVNLLMFFLQKLKKDPYVTTMGGFSKVTNYIFDAFRGTEEQHQRPPEEVADLLGEVIPGLEINQLEEPGFEVITRVRKGLNLHLLLQHFNPVQEVQLYYSLPSRFWKCFIAFVESNFSL